MVTGEYFTLDANSVQSLTEGEKAERIPYNQWLAVHVLASSQDVTKKLENTHMASLFDSPNFKNLLSSLASSQSEQIPPVIDLYRNPLRKKERNHIEAILSRLPDGSYARAIEKRLLSLNAANHYGAWHELMVYDWLSDLKKNPSVQPLAPDGKSKPDFQIESNGLSIFIDVASVQESRKDGNVGKNYGRPRGWWPGGTATFATMRERLIDKMGQHASITDAAYVVALCLESCMIDMSQVKTCFLGGEIVVSRTLRHDLNGEIFERDGDNSFLVKHSNVSGVLVANHSGISEDEGYKLVFGLIQNPYSHHKIHELEFGEIRRFVGVSESDGRTQMVWRY